MQCVYFRLFSACPFDLVVHVGAEQAKISRSPFACVTKLSFIVVLGSLISATGPV